MSDFRITYHGTVTLLYPLTPACREWITENVAVEDWQWFGSAAAGEGFAVEPRYVDTLVTALVTEGFEGEEE